MKNIKNLLLKRICLTALALFVVLFLLKNLLQQNGFDFKFVAGGTVFLFLVFLLSIFIHSSALFATNPHVFMRSVYMSMMIKMFSSAIALIIFVLYSNGRINTGGVFSLMLVYVIFTVVEVGSLMKALGNKNVEKGSPLK
ncbi:MAG: hypothetical protein NVSMB45_10010 [Ginsengibacter sp.]